MPGDAIIPKIPGRGWSRQEDLRPLLWLCDEMQSDLGERSMAPEPSGKSFSSAISSAFFMSPALGMEDLESARFSWSVATQEGDPLDARGPLVDRMDPGSR